MDMNKYGSITHIQGYTPRMRSEKECNDLCRKVVTNTAETSISRAFFQQSSNIEDIEKEYNSHHGFHDTVLKYLRHNEVNQLNLFLRLDDPASVSSAIPMGTLMLKDFIYNWMRGAFSKEQHELPEFVIDGVYSFYKEPCYANFLNFIELFTRFDSQSMYKTYFGGIYPTKFVGKYMQWLKSDMIDTYLAYLDILNNKGVTFDFIGKIFKRVGKSTITQIKQHENMVYILVIGGNFSTHNSDTQVACQFYKVEYNKIASNDFNPTLNSNANGNPLGRAHYMNKTAVNEITFTAEIPEEILNSFLHTIEIYTQLSGVETVRL